MQVSVIERTREIAIHIAIGAIIGVILVLIIIFSISSVSTAEIN